MPRASSIQSLRRSSRFCTRHANDGQPLHNIFSSRSAKCLRKCACKVKLSNFAISDVFNQFRLDDFLTDLTIVANDGTSFRVHKVIMMLHGTKFSKFFKNTDRVSLDASSNVVQEIINFAYTGVASINPDNFGELTIFAQEYQMQGLVKSGSECLLKQLNDENNVALYDLVCEFEFFCTGVRSKIRRRILQHFLHVNHHGADELLRLPLPELTELLSDDYLNCTEEDLFTVISRWCEKDKNVSSLVSCIRSAHISDYFLRQKEAEGHPLVINDPRFDPTDKARIPNEIVLCMGGWEQSEGPSFDIDSYNIREREWTKISKLRAWTRRAYHSLEVLDSQVFVIGGFQREPDANGGTYFAEMDSFNLEKRTWSQMTAMNKRRCYVMTASVGGKLYAFGGSEGQGLTRHQSAECYDPLTNEWSFIPNMISQRSDGAVAVGADGNIYIFGGFTGHEILSTVEIYDPERNAWSMGPSMSVPRSGCQAVCHDGHIYVMGGFDGSQRLALVESLATGPRSSEWRQWRRKSDMITQRSNFTATSIDGKIMVAGGFNGAGVTDRVEMYFPEENIWLSSTPLRKKKSALAMITVSDLENPERYLAKSSRCNHM